MAPSVPIGFRRVPAAKIRRVRFAEFEMHRDALELTRNGVRIRLQIQPFRVLETLVDRAGEVVSRDELRSRVWPSNVYVDFDHGLTNAITRLREALGDSAHEPRFIETIPRVGYRFIHPVARVPVDPDSSPPLDAAAAGNESMQPGREPAASRARRPGRRATKGVLFVVAAILTIFGFYQFRGHYGAEAKIRSIAVLPFRDLSEDQDQQYFASGMREALITRLAQNGSLRVVSRRAGERYRGGDKSIAEIATELQVDGVIESSILRRADHVRIDVQLIRAADESHVWAQSYERSIKDIFLLQRELADDISGEISSSIGAAADKQVSVPHSDSIEAYEVYLQGRHLWNQRNVQSVTKSLEYFERAIQLDPNFAAAYANLAEAYATLGGQTLVKSRPAEDLRPAAMAAARRAVELDNGLAEAHWALAGVLDHLFPQSLQRDAEIEREYLTALRLNPASADTRHGYGNFLSNRRRSEEAIAQYREALLLDPLSPDIMGRLGMELTNNGRVEQGMKLMQRAVEIEPWQFNAQLRLGWAYAAFERYAEANEAFELAEKISPGSPHTLAGRSFVAARSGDVASATATLAKLQADAVAIDAPFLVAIVYVGLKDRDGALEWLEKAASSANILGRRGLYGLDNPIYNWLRDDPRFAQIRQVVHSPTRDPDS